MLLKRKDLISEMLPFNGESRIWRAEIVRQLLQIAAVLLKEPLRKLREIHCLRREIQKKIDKTGVR